MKINPFVNKLKNDFDIKITRSNVSLDFESSYYTDNKGNITNFGWYDDWLYINDKENVPPNYEPKIITPKFVRKSIAFALKNGWDITNKTNKLEIDYRNGKFRLETKKTKPK